MDLRRLRRSPRPRRERRKKHPARRTRHAGLARGPARTDLREAPGELHAPGRDVCGASVNAQQGRRHDVRGRRERANCRLHEQGRPTATAAQAARALRSAAAALDDLAAEHFTAGSP